MVLDLHFVLGALLAALIVGIFAWLVEWFLGNAGVSFPRPVIWLVALVVWLMIILSGGIRV